MRFVGSIPVLVGCAGAPALAPQPSSPTSVVTEASASVDEATTPPESSRPDVLDTGATTGGGTSPTTALDADTGVVDTGTPGALGPVDCAPFATDPDWDVCVATADVCEVTFTDGSGCDAVCAHAGLSCLAAYDNVDGQCLGDLSSPVDCASSHQSDYCVCGGPQGPVDACATFPLSASSLFAELEGFGAGTLGGSEHTVARVTTLADDGPGSLREALTASTSQWVVFDVEGEITLDTPIEVAPYKTVDGRDRDITIRGNLRLEDTHDIVLTDLKLTNDLEGHCTQDGDVVTLIGDGGDDPSDFTTHDIWLHHLEVYDGGDGLVDLRGATDVTISWSHFHTHEKGMLLSTDRDGRDTGGMRVTMHHNYFDRLTRRAPQIAHGWLHTYNNVQYEWYEVAVASIDDAEVASEGNVYKARPGTVCITPCPDPNPCGDDDFLVSKTATSVDWAGDTEGRLRSVDDATLDGARIVQRDPTLVFEPSDHYTYTAEAPTEAMGLDIMDRAGPRDDLCP